ncbi:hypothetical protein OQJ65_16845 [Vibrio sp. Sgm 22]|uniref:hypothetical protein n=1 Tax=unclassified Vibrio TaxID=2614977 RepID=UPI002248AC5D|nr:MULTISPECIES: hypothetical protein [unclassified Vibrio]MCX2760002.1 hypothetical protein [Vibrio sp. 14G-20]MCX2776990.1 hypothetical protein [Vibrio sp. Sgm 22]
MKLYQYVAPTLAALALAGCGDDPLTDVTSPPIDPPPPVVVGESIYILHATEEINHTFEFWDTWGSGSTFATAQNSQYGEILVMQPGSNWGAPTSNIAWGVSEGNEIDATHITHANFKVRTTTANTVEVGIVTLQAEYKDNYAISSGTALSDGWVQMQVPVTPNAETSWFSLTFENAGQVELADVYLSEEVVVEPATDEFVLISSGSEVSDITFGDDTVQEWSTGTVFSGDSNYLGQNAWSITSGPKSPEEGNWGAVLVFNGGIEQDLSRFTYLDVEVATLGGFEKYAVTLEANGVSKELLLPVDDRINDQWQSVRLDLSNFSLETSNVSSIAIMGVGGTPGVSTFYVTDYKFVKTQEPTVDDNLESPFIILHSTSETGLQDVAYGEWSTGTVISSGSFDGLSTWILEENGSWGAVLAMTNQNNTETAPVNLVSLENYTNLKLKVAAEGAFDRFEVFLDTNVDGKATSSVIPFGLNDATQWNEIDIDLNAFGLALSDINQIAVYGVYTPETTGQTLYVTDFIAYDTGIHPTRDRNDYGDAFVMISPTSLDSDLTYDDSAFLNVGNAAFNEWSTGTDFNLESTYLGSNAWEMTKGDSWGAVVAFTGDVYGEILPFDFDMNQYKNLSFKLASVGALSDFKIAFNTTKGASYETLLTPTVGSDWKTYSFDMTKLPIDVNEVMQVAIFGSNGASGDKFYLTDMQFSK